MLGVARSGDALREYRYESAADSVLYPALKRALFAPLLARTPRSIPANALTLIAFALALGSALAAIGFGLWRARALPPLAGVLLFAYGTLDNIDGSQARRNGTSGPIGELLDHGVDSVVMFLIPLCFGAFFATPALALAGVTVGTTAFWSSMWAHHRLGKLPTTAVADVECVVVVSCFYVVLGIVGPEAIVARIGGVGPSGVELIMAAGILGSLGQLALCARSVPAGRLSALARFYAPQAVILAWYLLGGGAIGVGPCGALLGLAGSRAAILAIVTRLYKAPLRPLEPVSFAIGLAGLASAAAGVGSQRTIAIVAALLLALDLAVRFTRELSVMARLMGTRVFSAGTGA